VPTSIVTRGQKRGGKREERVVERNSVEESRRWNYVARLATKMKVRGGDPCPGRKERKRITRGKT